MNSQFNGDLTNFNLAEFEYKKPLGTHKPHFEGIPESYYPLTTCEIIKYGIFVAIAMLWGIALLAGFIQWVLSTGLQNYVEIWVILFLIFLVIAIVAFYIGGAARIKQER